MPISPARSAAFDILLRVERESSYAAELLHSSGYKHLSTPDHALATELVMGVLRWRSRLDREIQPASTQPLSKLDLEVLVALRLAVYQFRYLDRIPQRAALHESVELVKRARKTSAGPFVNAVLRKLSATSPGKAEPQEKQLTAEDLARTYSHPLWMVERWAHEYGLSIARQICILDQSPPPTVIRVRDKNFTAEEITLAPGALLSSARRVQSGDVTKTEAFRKGQIAIQDEASQLVAALVSVETSGKSPRILDCCAAPGGKTQAIADKNLDIPIIAVERHPHRARLMKKLLKGAAAKRIQIIAADARALPLSALFDCVLADVPCSGTGTLARNPEIKWRLSPSDLADLHDRQVAILRSVMERVAPKGRLIYSTCSLEKEENEDVIAEALAATKSFYVINCRTELDRLKSAGELTWPDPARLTRGSYLRTIPGLQSCDGFFAAILERI